MASSSPQNPPVQKTGRSHNGTPTRGETPPIPSTVWAPTEAAQPEAMWPTALLDQIVESLTNPGEHVALLPWPSHHIEEPEPAPTRAADIVHQLGRHPHLGSPGSTSEHDEPQSPLPAVDLVLTHCPPAAGNEAACQNLATTTAELLRTDGVLAVLTHTETTDGTLTDPTGPIVTAAQNADLLYLQHVVLLLAPIHDGALTPPEPPGSDTTSTPRPTAHQRIHADLLLFTNPTSQI